MAGKLMKMTIGPPPLEDLYIFKNDEMGRISRQIYTDISQADIPLRDWYLGYDENGLLVSKSIPVSESKKRPMFEFQYDTQKRLV